MYYAVKGTVPGDGTCAGSFDWIIEAENEAEAKNQVRGEIDEKYTIESVTLLSAKECVARESKDLKSEIVRLYIHSHNVPAARYRDITEGFGYYEVLKEFNCKLRFLRRLERVMDLDKKCLGDIRKCLDALTTVKTEEEFNEEISKLKEI